MGFLMAVDPLTYAVAALRYAFYGAGHATTEGLPSQAVSMAVTIGWWRSPGHLKNMMGKSHKRISVGQEQKHYTQMFGR